MRDDDGLRLFFYKGDVVVARDAEDAIDLLHGDGVVAVDERLIEKVGGNELVSPDVGLRRTNLIVATGRKWAKALGRGVHRA